MNKITMAVDRHGDTVARFTDHDGDSCDLFPYIDDGKPLMLLGTFVIDQETAAELGVLLSRFSVTGKLSHPMVFNDTCVVDGIPKSIKVKQEARDCHDPIRVIGMDVELSQAPIPMWWTGYNSGPLIEAIKSKTEEDSTSIADAVKFVADVVRSKSEPDNPAIWRRDSDKGNSSIFSMPDDDKDDDEVKVEEPKPETWRDRKPLL